MPSPRALLWWGVALGTAASALGCTDTATWWMETAPTWIGLLVLALLRQHWTPTPLVIAVLCVHALILAVGGHFTYAEVPFGHWLRDALALERNPFDRIGHCFQGITPALLVRELLWRTPALRVQPWISAVPIAAAGSISALYELIEWLAAVLLGQSAEAFLGTQGDEWDAQADMLCAFCGATLVVVVLSRWHSRQLREAGAAAA